MTKIERTLDEAIERKKNRNNIRRKTGTNSKMNVVLAGTKSTSERDFITQ